MTRNQRRRKAKAIGLARRNAEIVRANLSQPVERQYNRGLRVSCYFDGQMDRARIRGCTPMSAGPDDRLLSGSPVLYGMPRNNPTPKGFDPVRWYHMSAKRP